MLINKVALPLLSLLACLPSQAGATAVLGADLQALSTFANAYVSIGDSSSVFGNVWSGGVGTDGAGAHISGSFTSVGAATVGGNGTRGNARVDRDIIAGGALTTGDSAWVGGNVTAGGAATVGANAVVVGYLDTAGAVSTGAVSQVLGSIRSGGAASIGGAASVGGSVAAVGAITRALDSSIGITAALATSPVDTPALTANLLARTRTDSLQLLAAQSAFAHMTATTLFGPTITTDATLFPGVYRAASLSTTAGTTLRFDAQGKTNRFWVFNIADFLETGASTTIALLNGATSDSIIWNVGGYASLGASSTLFGTVIASQYVSVGANAAISNVGTSCGGVFSALSYVLAGAGAQIGSAGCAGIARGFAMGEDGSAYREQALRSDTGAVPEPAVWATLLVGFGIIGSSMRRRKLVVVAA